MYTFHIKAILKARFAAKGFKIDEETLALMQAVPAEGFKALPVERFTEEFLKALCEPYPEEFIKTIVLVPKACEVFFPELLQAQEVPAGPIEYHPEGTLFAHIVQVVAKCTTLEGRFAALMHDMGKLVTPKEKWPKHYGHDTLGVPLIKEICQRLKVPIHLVNIAVFVCKEHMRAARLIKENKLITLACNALRIGAGEALLEVFKADKNGRYEAALHRLEKALKVAAIPIEELGIPLEGNPQTVRERILQKRIQLLKQED